MRIYLPFRTLAISAATAHLAAGNAALEALDEAMLKDIVEAYVGHEATTCTSAASATATSFSFDWPGTNPDSNWYDAFEPFEEGNFQAIMSHTDGTGDRSWSIRIGTSGNMYSHYTPNMSGEIMPPQLHPTGPWIDEVQQSVSVNLALNKNLNAGADFCPGPNTENKTECKPYFIHQAGAYQQDSTNTDVPFFSPSLARHCSGNSCLFASWGTQAHVATPFTSPVIYINRYINCGNGVIEHTQMIHNFANPLDPASTPTDVDQTYFNVGWGGVRSSKLPYALEPQPSTGTLEYTDVNNVDYLPLCPWGSDAPGGPAGRAAYTDLRQLWGYTTFAEDQLLVNLTDSTSNPLPCRKPNNDCSTNPPPTDPNACMVESCTDAQVANDGYTRMELKVAANSSPGCRQHNIPNFNSDGVYSLYCNLRLTTGFGKTAPGGCTPWTNLGFVNTRTTQTLNVAHVSHWSWGETDKRVYFSVYADTAADAVSMVNGFFDNTGNGTTLDIEVQEGSGYVAQVPAGYDPTSFKTFTYVYGKGEEYVSTSVPGRSRRRLGSTIQGVGSRDYTVFTVNWHGGGIRLAPGFTYTNRQFYFSSDLGSVKATGDDLNGKTYADYIEPEHWNPRAVQIYTSGTNFAVVAAETAQGASTTCGAATLSCSGKSTPEIGHVPFFYVTCGTQTHFGPDPYHFTPSFGDTFPGHGTINNPVRSYLCDGQALSIRPSWKLMGFFDPTDSSCTSLAPSTYDESVCTPSGTTPSPSKAPTVAPTNSPTTAVPTTSPTTTPSSSPSKAPTDAPTNSPIVPVPTTSPTTTPSSSPSKAPTVAPTNSPIVPVPTTSPTTTPSSSPSKAPTVAPTNSPVTLSPTASLSPTMSPVTSSPTKGPSPSPTTKAPTKLPTAKPTTSDPKIEVKFEVTLDAQNLPTVQSDATEAEKEKYAAFILAVVEAKVSVDANTKIVGTCVIESGGVKYDPPLCSYTLEAKRRLLASLGIQAEKQVASRRLQNSEVVFELILEQLCDQNVGCGTDTSGLANKLKQEVAETWNDPNTASTFAAVLEKAALDVLEVTVDIGTIQAATFTDAVVLAETLLTCSYYPTWKDGSFCSNDCDHPLYMKKNPSQWLYSDLEACCMRYYNWDYDTCIVGSGGSLLSSVTDKWYVNYQSEICQQDCPEGGPCGGPAQNWDELFETADACCEDKLSWVPSATCVAQSTLNQTVSLVGTSLWYVDWVQSKCVKDCEDSSDIHCRNLAKPWDQLFTNSNECCDRLFWVDRDECTD